jgi:hypothetical protein
VFDKKLEQLSAFLQLVFCFDGDCDVRANAEEADDLAVSGSERVFSVIDPAMRTIGEFEALDFICAVPLGEDLLIFPRKSTFVFGSPRVSAILFVAPTTT